MGFNELVRSKEPVSYNDPIRPIELFGSDEHFSFGFNDPDRTTGPMSPLDPMSPFGPMGPSGSMTPSGPITPSDPMSLPDPRSQLFQLFHWIHRGLLNLLGPMSPSPFEFKDSVGSKEPVGFD